MSKKLDITENHLLTLALFTHGYHQEYYIREIASHLPISHGTVQTILNDLEAKQVFESSTRGKVRMFRLKKSRMAADYLNLAELYKKILFLDSAPYVAEILQKIDAHITGCAVIFGSFAAGIPKEGSDLDLFVAGSYDQRAVEQIAARYAIEVNVVAYPRDVFERDLGTDHLLLEVMRNHVIWKDIEYFVRVVMES